MERQLKQQTVSFQYKFCTSPKPNESACLESCAITGCWDGSENRQTQLLELPTEHAQPVSQQETGRPQQQLPRALEPSRHSFLYYALKHFNMLNRTQIFFAAFLAQKLR